ncbi:hypothetical protein G7K_2227-t1 [Saitoella complicata NRRL Y-17804]|uniref:Uncharacterized protein n=1 Tax=Saitoella complicata (strain BCRC 22490 / CBS 7301 / JCM 7358 / NBRC 10748 / NRRL Y-17804) TaxID=698492 RepID=A0A0E9NDW7_SAICN|nr:hypothetical protein G7K_2227-t1 [Saitoella complicata NRRL Y-17804]
MCGYGQTKHGITRLYIYQQREIASPPVIEDNVGNYNINSENTATLRQTLSNKIPVISHSHLVQKRKKPSNSFTPNSALHLPHLLPEPRLKNPPKIPPPFPLSLVSLPATLALLSGIALVMFFT